MDIYSFFPKSEALQASKLPQKWHHVLVFEKVKRLMSITKSTKNRDNPHLDGRNNHLEKRPYVKLIKWNQWDTLFIEV